MNSAREAAIAAVTNYKSTGQALNFKETPASELFASNVFTDAVMKDRLPKAVYKALQKTIKTADKLDPTVADAVALAMKDWAIEKGATHYAHVFYPLTGITAEKHDSFLSPTGDGHASGRVRGQGTDPGRARRFELSVGRHPGHVRSPRLHGLGSDQPGLHSGKPQRHDALHSDGLCFLDRRSARQEDAGAAVDAGLEQAGPEDFEAVRP